MIVAAQGADDPPECAEPEDVGDDSNPATRLRFDLPDALTCRSEKA
jgi:hypothetical protein